MGVLMALWTIREQGGLDLFLTQKVECAVFTKNIDLYIYYIVFYYLLAVRLMLTK